MTKAMIEDLLRENDTVRRLSRAEELVWINPERGTQTERALGMADIEDAEARLRRFAPLIARLFPETADRGGVIESELIPIPKMRARLGGVAGRLLLKADSHLPIAGSVKARGGIYEVLKHTEDLALANGLLAPGEGYEKLAEPECRGFFGGYTVQVGSTGNLGMSIGIMSAALGYRAVVHMSADAKQWKKDLLRAKGVTVIEYESDYSEAVRNGRKLSEADPGSYFVDDENSRDLFLGYAAAAKRLPAQLAALGVTADEAHPLFVYLPCGVGGAPGGITFGLKRVFGDAAHCFFVEPTQAPCMTLGMASGLNSGISVKDIGLTGLTEADGLAVGRPSGFVGGMMRGLLSGAVTVRDERLYTHMRALWESEGIFLEPSACAASAGMEAILKSEEGQRYLRENGLADRMDRAAHIVWATGGSLVPEAIREEYIGKR